VQGHNVCKSGALSEAICAGCVFVGVFLLMRFASA
jgi:hypothetical protein